MVKWQGAACSVRRRLAWKLMTGAAIIVLAAGCTRTSKKDSPHKRLAAFNYTKQAQRPALKPNNPLHIATTQWARKHQKNPADPKAAVNYARNLKALGSKDRALEVLARTYQLNPNHAVLASEYGRLALDMGKVQMAERLLNKVQRARGQTDWRVLSALGTVNAKRGAHKKAQSYYLAALRQKPDATSVFNNLALSYALDGRVGDAEDLLKRAVAKGHNTRRVRQNLALVLGLQSKFGEAQQVAKADLDGDKIDNNVSYMRNMVKTTRVAKAPPAKAGNKGKAQRKADTITTAALPASTRTATAAKGTTAAKTPIPRRKPSAGVTRVAAPARNPAVKAAMATAKKAPAKQIEVATATPTATKKTTTKRKPEQAASVLPWQKKPATATRTASLSPDDKSGAPTRLSAKTEPSWSTMVSAAPAATTRDEPESASKKADTFAFPSAN